MTEQFIAVLDSGIGGISILNQLVKNFPDKNFLYFGDNKNAPYGNKSISQLFEITKRNLDYIKHYNIIALVLGCNTLSVNLISDISEYSGVQTFGVFPPVERCLIYNEKTLLLSTCATAEKFKEFKGVDVLGLKNLVNDIENNAFNLEKVNLNNNLINSDGFFVNEKGYYDNVILGCTHYVFIKNKIFDHFCPKRVLSGNDFTLKRIKNFILNNKSLVKYKQNKVLFLGDSAEFNKKFYVISGQKD